MTAHGLFSVFPCLCIYSSWKIRWHVIILIFGSSPFSRTCVNTHGRARAWIPPVCFSLVQLSLDTRGLLFCLSLLSVFLPLSLWIVFRHFEIPHFSKLYLEAVTNHLLLQIPFHLVTRLWDTYLAEGDALPDFLVYIAASFLLTVRYL